MYSLNLALWEHFWNIHVQGSNQGGIVFFDGLFLNVFAFIRMKHLDWFL